MKNARLEDTTEVGQICEIRNRGRVLTIFRRVSDEYVLYVDDVEHTTSASAKDIFCALALYVDDTRSSGKWYEGLL